MLKTSDLKQTKKVLGNVEFLYFESFFVKNNFMFSTFFL